MAFHAVVLFHVLFLLGDFGAPQRQRDAMAGVPDIAEPGFFAPPATSNTPNSFHKNYTVSNY
jgi:hypothetical protein